jgi:DNA repair protein RadA/Sms
VSPKWLGRCPDCGEWNSFVEEAVMAPPQPAGKTPAPVSLGEAGDAAEARVATGSAELDRVLGGGAVPGSVILLGGDPGIGKTTLLLECLGAVSREGTPALYVTGEESPRQIRLRADRIGVSSQKLFVLSHNVVGAIIAEAERLKPAFLVIDSIQTMMSTALESAPGSVGQVRQVAAEIIPWAKGRDLPVFLVGHVTKDGALAGPRVLEHMVDTVLYFEGEGTRDYRILRAVKNRFGSTNEIGIFEMTVGGLRDVANPSRLFLGDGRTVAGSVVTASLEGTRPFLVEVQALTALTSASSPRRACSGTDASRAAMLTAVLEKRLGFALHEQDIYINLAGGIRVVEPAADAAIIGAIASSFRGAPVDHRDVVIGEVGLTGEIRPVSGIDRRVGEAAKLGFRRVVVPLNHGISHDGLPNNIEIVGVSGVEELLQAVIL